MCPWKLSQPLPQITLTHFSHTHSHTSLTHSISDIEKGYYADGEDAYDMKKVFVEKPVVGDGESKAADAVAEVVPVVPVKAGVLPTPAELDASENSTD